MPRRLLISLLLIAALPLGGCKEFEQLFLAQDEPMKPCDPTYSTYHGYVHFIERDFLTRDQTLDYRKWFESNQVEASQCDPLKARDRAADGADGPPPAEKMPAAPADDTLPVP